MHGCCCYGNYTTLTIMAHKYDLVTVPSQSSGTVKHFPWYKERLKWKYIQPRKQSNILRGTQWRFVRTDTDDFRTGIPRAPDKNSIVYKLETGSVPVVDPVASQLRVSRRRTVSNKKQRPISATAMMTLNSKVGARMQEKLRRITEAEESLLEHPLGLYPHLEEALPPELADYIFDVLEPEIRASDTMSDDEEQNISDEAASITSTVECEEQQDKQDEKIVVVDNQAALPTSQSPSFSKTGIYKWPLMDTPEEEAREQRLLAEQRAISPTQQYRVNTVTRDLVKWSENMGGDGPLYIDEMTIKKLFASDEAKPTLTVPIHVMDHSSVPNELMMKSSHFSSRSQSHTVHTENTPSEVVHGHHPSYIRTRYGAWYLHPKLWKPLPFNEPLRNPREEAKEKDQESRRKSEALDAALAETHGAKAFKDFIAIRPGIAMPKFLKNINFKSDYSKHQSRK